MVWVAVPSAFRVVLFGPADPDRRSAAAKKSGRMKSERCIEMN
jgi:hypothetical protein